MKGLILGALLMVPTALHAQSTDKQGPSLRQQLMPASAVALTAPSHVSIEKSKTLQPMISRGGGMGYMIAGGALFVAGLLVDGDAGTILVLSGAGIGAYGLYLHFR
jgi:hypothetical protein